MLTAKSKTHEGTPSSKPLEMHSLLSFKVQYLSSSLVQVLRTFVLKPNDLRLTEWRILATLTEIGPASATEIGRVMVLDLGRVSRVVRAMMKSDLVIREFSQTDKRVAHYRLSNHGQRTFERVWPQVQHLWDELDKAFDAGEKEILLRLLDKLIASVEEKTEAK